MSVSVDAAVLGALGAAGVSLSAALGQDSSCSPTLSFGAVWAAISACLSVMERCSLFLYHLQSRKVLGNGVPRAGQCFGADYVGGSDGIFD